MGKKCSVAFVGAGNMTTEHLKSFKDIIDVDLVGIYSRTKSKSIGLANTYGIMHVYDSITEMFLNGKPDLVVISVPELALNGVVREAFQFSWTCLIEKPAGYNLADAKEILELANKNSSKVFVALNRRHYSSTLEVQKLISESNEPRVIIIQDQEDPKSALVAGQPELVTKNWMYANSIHIIDYFQIFARGELVNTEIIEPYNPNSPFFVHAKLTFKSGDIGIYQAFWNAPGPWSVVVNTQSKRYEMKPLEKSFIQEYRNRNLVELPVNSWDLEFKPGLRRQAQEVVNSILIHEYVSDLPTLEEAFMAMKITHSIYKY
jgi:predicted dehydrogenase